MSPDLENQIVDTWNINNRINLYLLEAIPADALSDISASKGRTVAEQVAHLHNVRLMWLKVSGPDLMEGLEKIEKEAAADKKLLARRLKESGQAMEALLKKAIENGGKVKGFKPHVTAFLGYVIAHESHHRGQIALSLKQSGHPLDKKVGYGIWEWGVR
ncbi:MAG: DinB family protein [Acidobacteriota bacterium]